MCYDYLAIISPKGEKMEEDVKLSICIPTYNRMNELKNLLSSILNATNLSYLEVIIVDDASSDNTKLIIDKYSHLMKINYYVYQKNYGRSVALKKAIELAEGEYVAVMDSDDIFTDRGIDEVFEGIAKLENGNFPEDVCSLIFGCKLIFNRSTRTNIPPAIISNFVELRADYKVCGDLKEVVESGILKKHLYDVPYGCRRVPTSLLWAKVAESTRCLCVDKVIVIKRYLTGGMSDKILQLKSYNPEPMVNLYVALSDSKSYKSTKYRLRCRILWARYACHYGQTRPTLLWQYIVWPFGFLVYLIDKVRLIKN